MIVLSEIQRDPARVKELPTLLKPSVAKKKPIPAWVTELKARAGRMTEDELFAIIDEALAGK